MTDAAIVTFIDGDHDRTISACGREGVMVQGRGGGFAGIMAIEYLSEKRTAELDRQGSTTLEAGMAST